MPVHFRFKSREKPPIALHVCHESRALALKHYIPSFHSTTFPLDCASVVKQTALYFNPELDTVHILNARGTGIWTLSCRTQRETIQSIKVLAIGSYLFQELWIQHIAGRLPVFESLEMLILVIEREVGRNGKELIRVNMEDELVNVQDRLALRENSKKEWKLPVVKVMTRRVFENHSQHMHYDNIILYD